MRNTYFLQIFSITGLIAACHQKMGGPTGPTPDLRGLNKVEDKEFPYSAENKPQTNR